MAGGCWTFNAYSPPQEDSTFISFFSLIRLAVFWPEAALVWNFMNFGSIFVTPV
jgi:hypothetical protein